MPPGPAQDVRDRNSIRLDLKSEVRDAVFRPSDPRFVACAAGNGVVQVRPRVLPPTAPHFTRGSLLPPQIFDMRTTKRPWATVTAHVSTVMALAWHPSRPDLLATGGIDRTIKARLLLCLSRLSPSTLPDTLCRPVAADLVGVWQHAARGAGAHHSDHWHRVAPAVAAGKPECGPLWREGDGSSLTLCCALLGRPSRRYYCAHGTLGQHVRPPVHTTPEGQPPATPSHSHNSPHPRQCARVGHPPAQHSCCAHQDAHGSGGRAVLVRGPTAGVCGREGLLHSRHCATRVSG